MIHDELVTYEVAKLAKEKGFDEATYYTYDEESKQLNRMRHCVKRNSRIGSIIKLIAAPTQSLLQRWLREEKGIIVIPYYRSVLRMWSATYELTSPCTFEDLRKCFKTYELALEDALKYALKNLV